MNFFFHENAIFFKLPIIAFPHFVLVQRQKRSQKKQGVTQNLLRNLDFLGCFGQRKLVYHRKKYCIIGL